MQRSLLLFLSFTAPVALTACPSTGGGGTDAGTDTGVHFDAGSHDAGTMDSGSSGTGVTIAQLVNPTASGHPAANTNVTVMDTIVALSPRLFISQSTTSGKCLFAVWVGNTTGSDYSGIEVIDSFLPPPGADGGAGDCFTAPPNVIPDTVMIGSAITALAGQYEEFCPSGTTCPAGTAQELAVTSGTFTASGMATVPPATSVSVADVTGMGTTLGARDIALQGALVKLTGTHLQVAPSAANHDVMMVSDGTGATPTMAISVSKYSGVGCQRTALGALTAGASVGDITGVLQYSFGQWVIQPRQPADLPSVVCPADGGAGDGP